MRDSPTLTLPVGARDHIQGNADAPVTLVEYGDYECPHCGRAYPIVKEVQGRLGAKLRFVFRNFPISGAHPHAEMAAEAAELAAAQGRFWEMHDALYEHQNTLDEAGILALATKLKLDASKLGADLAGGAARDRVKEDFMSGVRSGVNGTPTFFINGVRFDDSWDAETLTAALEDAALRRGEAAG
jgi:protein-disulfide isomerase